MTLPVESQSSQPPENTSAVVESRFHTYVGNRIPWYVRLIWLLFWIFAIYYVTAYLFPDLQSSVFKSQ